MTEQGWPAAAASFLFMWVAMMIPMMLPSLVPMLWRYRDLIGDVGPARRTVLTAIVCLAYFLVWSAVGLAAFLLSVVLTRAMLPLIGIIVLIAGALQLTAWKARHRDCRRQSPGRELLADSLTAWQHGLRLGVHCFYSDGRARDGAGGRSSPAPVVDACRTRSPVRRHARAAGR